MKGVYPIITTPYTVHGDVDLESLQNVMVTRHRAGVNGFVLFGIGGEYYKQTDDEGKTMLKAVTEASKKLSTPLVVSVTQHATVAACKAAQYYEQAGADILMVLPPYFLKPSGEDVYNHIKTIAKSVKKPILVQYAPEQTGVSISTDIWRRLSNECENVNDYKIECKPSGHYISSMMTSFKQKPNIYIGNCGLQMIEAFDRGALGVMPGCAFVEVYVKIYQNYIAGNRSQAISLHNALMPLLNHIRQSVEMLNHYEKRILKMRGIIDTDYCRAPGFVPDQHDDELFFAFYSQLEPLLAE